MMTKVVLPIIGVILVIMFVVSLLKSAFFWAILAAVLIVGYVVVGKIRKAFNGEAEEASSS